MRLLVPLLGLLLVAGPADAAIAASVLAQAHGTAAGNAVTTGSITPVSGQLILVFFSEQSVNGSQTLTGTNGLNVTWTLVTATNGPGSFKQTTVFRGVASSSVAGTLTFSESTLTGTVVWSVVTYSGVNLTTNQGVVQFANSGTSCNPCTTVSVTLAAFASPSNATVETGFTTSNTTYTAKAGFTGSFDASAAGGTQGVSFQNSSDTGPNNDWGASVDSHAIALELSATTPPRHRVYQQ